MESNRVKKVAQSIQQQIALIINREVKDPRLALLNITEVRVTKDLGIAHIYFTLIGDTDKTRSLQALEALKKASGFIRAELSKAVHIRSVPQLHFHLDELGEKSDRLFDLIKKDAPF